MVLDIKEFLSKYLVKEFLTYIFTSTDPKYGLDDLVLENFTPRFRFENVREGSIKNTWNLKLLVSKLSICI